MPSFRTSVAASAVAVRPGPASFEPPAVLCVPDQPGLTGSRVAFSLLTGDGVVVRSYVTAGTGALEASASSSTAG